MTQYERMVKGLIYDPGDREILEEQLTYQDGLWAFNQLRPGDIEKKQEYMRTVFAECGENSYIELPLRANWGGHHLHLGSGVYINANLIIRLIPNSVRGACSTTRMSGSGRTPGLAQASLFCPVSISGKTQ